MSAIQSIGFLVILFFCCLACQNEQKEEVDVISEEVETAISFDKTKWNVKEGSDYPFRDQMLNDLIYNDTVRTLNREEILELLGAPSRVNEGHLYYTIAQKRLLSWPLHTKTLVIKLSENNTIVWMKIHE